MTNQAKTEHSKISFRVSEGIDNAYVSTRETIDAVFFRDGAELFFELNDDSFESAQQVVKFLNDHIKSVGVTVFSRHPMFNQSKGQ